MDPNEPRWRTNSSFSPPASRRWDCRFQSDVLSHRSYGAPLYGSSLSSNSKGSRSILSSDQYPNHYHSVSDGALSYFGSPSDNFQAPRWTPPLQKFNFPEFATTSAGGSRPGSSVFPHSSESHFIVGGSAVSNSFGSPSPLSESGRLESSRTPLISFPQRNFSSRRSFMSKPVYPLVFRNPVSDSEACATVDTASGSRSTPCENRTSSLSPDGTSNLELKKMEASPDPSTSSRREGFRWSNASSYDMGFDGDSIDITDHIDSDNLRPAYNSTTDQKCGLCGRLLWQKSPWSSYRIVRTSDMPTTGVLSCSHVFHAECLDQATPKTQIHDPPCPMCQKTAVGAEVPLLTSEPLETALRAVRTNQAVDITNGEGTSSRQPSDQTEYGLRRNWSLSLPRRDGGSLIKKHFKKHLSFKGRTGKDLLGVKLFCGTGSSSSAPVGR